MKNKYLEQLSLNSNILFAQVWHHQDFHLLSKSDIPFLNNHILAIVKKKTNNAKFIISNNSNMTLIASICHVSPPGRCFAYIYAS